MSSGVNSIIFYSYGDKEDYSASVVTISLGIYQWSTELLPLGTELRLLSVSELTLLSVSQAQRLNLLVVVCTTSVIITDRPIWLFWGRYQQL